MSAYFVTATGTDIGKTFVTAGLIRYLREHGQPVAALKPIVSGYDPSVVETSDPAVLRNALVPIVTAISLDIGRLLGGALIVETIFAWPGMGTLMLTAVGNRDYVIVQACLLLLVGVFILVNLLADISYGFIAPRIRMAH